MFSNKKSATLNISTSFGYYKGNQLFRNYHACSNDNLQSDEIEGTTPLKRETKKIWELFHQYKIITMVLSSFTFFVFILIYYVDFVFCFPLGKRCTTPNFNFTEINTLISFGDSYTTRYLDMDNLEYACRNCTSAGGPNWVIYLTESTNWISFDFAYNSAPINNTIVDQAPNVTDVSTQVRDLYPQVFVSPNDNISAIVASKYQNNTVRTANSTLTTFWVGINDIDLTYNWNNTDSLDHLIMEKYRGLVKELIKEGESQFMFINVPPIHRAPLWFKTQDEKVIMDRVAEYNKKVQNSVKKLQNNFPEVTFLEYDAWSYFNYVLDHATDYGISNNITYCPDWSQPAEYNCTSIEEYFWLNDLHPTFRVHELVAQDMQKYLVSL